ncbi:ABC transporter substrate-binding protein [Streptomyces sp. NPDC050560]|uniref:ABC transporter substrate-binding protein n=1 Tax=Streptomyces sp. NPDC050560 TaxID=3365630 RepID=UPI003791906D
MREATRPRRPGAPPHPAATRRRTPAGRRTLAPRRALTAAAASLALTAALAACGDDSGQAGAGGGSGSALTVPTASVSAAQGAFQYTVKKGFFAENGLRVTTPLSAEGQLKAAFVAGSVKFDQLAGGDVLDLYAKHVKISTIACVAKNNGYYVYAPKGTSSLADLKGKTVGVPSLGGAPQVAMQAYLKSKGLAADSVKFVALGSIPNVLTALTSGKVDGGLLSTPFNFRADKAGLKGLGYAQGPPSPFVVDTDWAKKNRGTVTKILKSLAKGAWSYQTHKEDGVKTLGAFLHLDPAKPADKETLGKSFDAYLPPVQAPPGRCDTSYFAPYTEYQPAAQQAALKDLKPLVDNSWVDALDRQHFYQKLQKTYGPLPKDTTLAQVLR